MKRLLRYVATFLVLFLLNQCSSERNSFTSKAYHNTTAHYNGYFYAKEEIKKIEKTIWSGQIDDYNKVLRLYPELDSAQAKGYDGQIQETIKMASIAIQRHPNSKWVDDCYILVGKARLYSLDWGNAIQTFKFVNTKSKEPSSKQKAITNLIRTFTEHEEFNNAQAAIDFLQKEEMDKPTRKNFLLEKAYFHQMQGDYDNMIRSLSEAVPLLGKKDKPGRIYFIIGQVYQKLGFEAEAYNFYKKCIATNPEYEVDFYARLYMAQVTEISRSRNVNAARKSFKKLLKDSKNKDFKDKIYYEMGVFELKQKNIEVAISDFNQSIRTGSNTRIDGEAYLKLGEIYYDTLKNYSLSKAYYDSAVTSLPTDYEGYAAIKTRKEILDEFVLNLTTIQWQDSLLSMVSLDSASLRARIDSVLEKQNQALAKSTKKKKRSDNRIDISDTNNNIFAQGQEGTEQTGWYFANTSAVALGQTEFRRIWGEIKLEDNWRRSMRSAATEVRTTALTQTQQVQAENTAPTEAEKIDPAAVEYERISKEIPRTPEQKQEALAKIETAYFNLGDIYYFKLFENDNAIIYYNKLLSRFPESEYEAEVLYKLYLIYKDSNPEKANQYAAIVKSKFPESSFAKILVNPNYLEESSLAVEKQKALYKEAYSAFGDNNLSHASEITKQALALGETSFTPNLKLLEALIIGKTENVNQYQLALEQFIKQYPESELIPYAKKLLQSIHDFQLKQEQKGVQYIRSFEEPHYFVVVHRKADNLSTTITSTLEKFNQQYFKDSVLKTSNLTLDETHIVTFVTELTRLSSAIEYKITFNEKLGSLTELRNHKFNTFVITKDNFDIFYRTKGLDEYIQFFEKNYPAESQ